MADLVPVDHDPFAGASASPVAAVAPNLVPVDHDPFGAQQRPLEYDQYGAPTAESLGKAQSGSGLTLQKARQFAEDQLTRTASSLSFGTIEKAAAALKAARGEGTYEENLKANRADTEEAGKRLGSAAILGDVGGGVLSASALAKAGLTALGSLKPGAGWVARTLAGGVEGAGYGAAQATGHTDNPADYGKNALEGAKQGALFGAAAPTVLSAVGRGVTPFPTDPTRQAAVRTLEEAGVPVSAGNRTGNEALRTAEDYVSKLPLGTLISKNPSAESMKAVTQAAAVKAGLPAGEVPTAEVLKKGFDTVGGKIGSIQKAYPVAVDDALVGDAVNIADGIPALLPGRQASAHHFLNKITSGTEITPEIAQTTRTQLNRAIRAQNGQMGDKEYQGVLFEIKNALDDALTRTIQKGGNAAHVAELQQARQQYANLHTLSDALYSSGPRGQLGQLTPGALQTGMARALGKGAYMQGKGDLTPLASASKAILPQVPDSGTATREGILNPVKWGLSLPGQLGVNSRPAQAYWGNQLLPPGAANAASQPVVAGLLAAQEARKHKGLLNP